MLAYKQRKTFTILITYFKNTGKLYATEEVDRDFRCNDAGNCYMPDVVAWIRGLRDNGDEGPLSGLDCYGWSGYIVVDCEYGYQCLILPKGK